MKKKIIFFDGDGTLWYPKKTKHTEKPHWIYKIEGTLGDYCKQLTLTPGVLSTLKKLKDKHIILVVLSTHPHPPKEAQSIIHHKISYFKLASFFDEVHATREYHASKGEFILEILKKRGIPKNKALMVGDHYLWDYKSAKDVGVDAFLIESNYMKKDKRIKTLSHLRDLFTYL